MDFIISGSSVDFVDSVCSNLIHSFPLMRNDKKSYYFRFPFWQKTSIGKGEVRRDLSRRRWNIVVDAALPKSVIPSCSCSRDVREILKTINKKCVARPVDVNLTGPPAITQTNYWFKLWGLFTKMLANFCGVLRLSQGEKLISILSMAMLENFNRHFGTSQNHIISRTKNILGNVFLNVWNSVREDSLNWAEVPLNSW